MKHNKTKYAIIATVMFLVATASIRAIEPFENQSGWQAKAPSAATYEQQMTGKTTFLGAPPPSYAPPGEGDPQKLPVTEGFCILAGLAVVYGIVRRRSMIRFTRIKEIFP